MRIVIGSIMHESNTFSPIPTPLEAFHPRMGPDLLRVPSRGSLGGIIARLSDQGTDLIPAVHHQGLAREGPRREEV